MLAESLFSTLEAGAHEAARKVAGLLAFEGLNRGRAADERVRPFNFLLVCYPDRLLGLPPGADPTRFRLVAPYERDATKWIRMRWFEAHAGQVFPITTYGTGGGGSVLVKTYGEIVEEYRVHEETKSVGPDYHPCGKKTRGLLRRRRVKMRGKPRHIGKESNRLEERLAGIVTNEDDYLVKLGDDSSWSRLVIPAVRRLGFQAVRKKSGIERSSFQTRILHP